MENNNNNFVNNNFGGNGKSFSYTPDPDKKIWYLISLLIASGILGGMYIYRVYWQVDSILVLIQEIHSLNLDLVHFSTNTIFEDLQEDLVVKYFRRLRALDELQLLLPHASSNRIMDFFFERYSLTTNIHNIEDVRDFLAQEYQRVFRGPPPPRGWNYIKKK